MSRVVHWCCGAVGILLLLILPALAQTVGGTVPRSDAYLEQISSDPSLRSFSSALRASGLARLLDEGDVTLFAPTDAAFDALDPDRREILDASGSERPIVTLVGAHIALADLSIGRVKRDIAETGGSRFATLKGVVQFSMKNEQLFIRGLDGQDRKVVKIFGPVSGITTYVLDGFLWSRFDDALPRMSRDDVAEQPPPKARGARRGPPRGRHWRSGDRSAPVSTDVADASLPTPAVTENVQPLPEPAWTSDAFGDRVKATRVFSGPTQYPPERFKAYGILAFPAMATSEDRARHLAICQAYVHTLNQSTEVRAPLAEQMATVWPIDSDSLANELNGAPRNEVCERGVDNYGLLLAQNAIRQARLAHARLGSRGPYLLAWAPPGDIGKPSAAILIVDLSDINAPDRFKAQFQAWAERIEEDPSIWNDDDGWRADIDGMRLVLRRWADDFGADVLKVVGLPGED